jgi:2,3-bisphosphoglycerate-dependent phosphoglycerate mutase
MNSFLMTVLFFCFACTGLFTGWDDVPLAIEGVEEAKAAGQLLKLHGFEFDVVYTSWLSRAIETAWYVMDEMDCLW